MKEISCTFEAALVMAPSIIVKRTELAGLWVDSALAMPPSIRKGEISGTLGDSALAMTPSINAKRTENCSIPGIQHPIASDILVKI